MGELQVIARYTIADNAHDDVMALLSELAEASRTEPGTLSFVVYQRPDDPREVVLLERYASREALAAHRETPHFARLVLGEIVPRLESRVVELFDATSPG
ncbi:putative quinol monooxygenase [Amycolatopsis sp. A133]|jgi:quinol monooxygenase YgiN|uniref:putative quinol monooxygenase n=1 Tax=Amycolatopsis sp. A133 TaxID=3064472 RepID=UPI0027FE073A|nr:putative quinol monooxygenase [Amycolatopsis sp. A133]MDQ7803480.1 putative quinol monooxygenase [Amycolatopsis sp. A133]